MSKSYMSSTESICAFFPPLFVSSDPTAIARKAHVLSMLAGSSFAISALSTICFAGAVFGGGLLP